MGKTKTAFVSDTSSDVLSGKEKYEKRKKEKDLKEKQESGEKVKIAGLKGGQRISAIDAQPVENEEKEQAKKRKIKSRGSKWIKARAKIEDGKFYTIPEAVKLIREISYSSFKGTVELHIVVKKTGMSVSVSYPHSFGKSKKIVVADEKIIANLGKGIVDFDVLLSTPEMMLKLVPFAKLLGPKGLMPNPKNGTLIKNLKDADKFSSSGVTLKTEKSAPIIHTKAGNLEMKDEEIIENINTVFEAVNPKQIERVFVKATMSPSLKIKI